MSFILGFVLGAIAGAVAVYLPANPDKLDELRDLFRK